MLWKYRLLKSEMPFYFSGRRCLQFLKEPPSTCCTPILRVEKSFMQSLSAPSPIPIPHAPSPIRHPPSAIPHPPSFFCGLENNSLQKLSWSVLLCLHFGFSLFAYLWFQTWGQDTLWVLMCLGGNVLKAILLGGNWS